MASDREIAGAFDRIAGDYDAAYGPGGNAVMSWMRRESLAFLKHTFPPGSRLLELGCGTGTEAVALACEGRSVVATDISPRMAALTQSKAQAVGVGDRVRAVALPASGAVALRPTQPFDGAYASFGGLNCETNLPAVGQALARLLKPGGCVVTSIMGRTCLFEMAWYLAHLRPRRAFRRLRRGWQPAPVAGRAGREVTVPTRFLTVRDLIGAFGAAFVVEDVWALPLLLPPPYADRLFRQRQAVFDRLEFFERRLRHRWPWRHLGDHLVVVLRRKA
jgi:ubiquinone/menaquinone biosynthesis C-methylase UbiE